MHRAPKEIPENQYFETLAHAQRSGHRFIFWIASKTRETVKAFDSLEPADVADVLAFISVKTGHPENPSAAMRDKLAADVADNHSRS